MAINLRYNYSQITRTCISLQRDYRWLMLGPGSPIHSRGSRTKPCPGCEWTRSYGSPQPRVWWLRWVGYSRPPMNPFMDVNGELQVIRLCLAFRSCAFHLAYLPLLLCDGHKSLTAHPWQGMDFGHQSCSLKATHSFLNQCLVTFQDQY